MYRERQRKVYNVLILQCKGERNKTVIRFEQICFKCSPSEKGLSNHVFRYEAYMHLWALDRSMEYASSHLS